MHEKHDVPRCLWVLASRKLWVLQHSQRTLHKVVFGAVRCVWLQCPLWSLCNRVRVVPPRKQSAGLFFVVCSVLWVYECVLCSCACVRLVLVIYILRKHSSKSMSRKLNGWVDVGMTSVSGGWFFGACMRVACFCDHENYNLLIACFLW